jgi:hypothetical protein
VIHLSYRDRYERPSRWHLPVDEPYVLKMLPETILVKYDQTNETKEVKIQDTLELFVAEAQQVFKIPSGRMVLMSKRAFTLVREVHYEVKVPMLTLIDSFGAVEMGFIPLGDLQLFGDLGYMHLAPSLAELKQRVLQCLSSSLSRQLDEEGKDLLHVDGLEILDGNGHIFFNEEDYVKFRDQHDHGLNEFGLAALPQLGYQVDEEAEKKVKQARREKRKRAAESSVVANNSAKKQK